MEQTLNIPVGLENKVKAVIDKYEEYFKLYKTLDNTYYDDYCEENHIMDSTTAEHIHRLLNDVWAAIRTSIFLEGDFAVITIKNIDIKWLYHMLNVFDFVAETKRINDLLAVPKDVNTPIIEEFLPSNNWFDWANTPWKKIFGIRK